MRDITDALTVNDRDFADRLQRFHRSVYASGLVAFDEVMVQFFEPQAGCVAQDHCLVHDGRRWHLFVLSQPLDEAQPMAEAVRNRDWSRAKQHPYCIGEVHAVGPTLFDLKPAGRILDKPQGEFATLNQCTSFIHRYDGRWVDVYTAAGPEMGQSLCLAWSDDLDHWEMDDRNPIWRPPSYAAGTTVCKNPCVVQHEGRYLIYYSLNLAEGLGSVALFSTTNFRDFVDHGPVCKQPFQFRGTQGVESCHVLLRDGLWHLFYGSGEGWWHAVSNRPDRFQSTQGFNSTSVQGVYCMGPFHACEIVEHDGRWWMTSTYKEEHRRKCRLAGKRIFRGEHDDESGMCAGLFVSEILWDGDRPMLVKPTPP